MSISSSAQIAADVERVVELFTTEAFVKQVSKAAGGTLESYEVLGETTGAFETQTVRAIPSSRLPEFARKFVGSTLTLKQRETWSAPSPDGSRQIFIEAKVSGVPVEANATQTLTSQGESTQVDLNGSVKCGIPLFGDKVAKAAEPALGKALQVQVREAQQVFEG